MIETGAIDRLDPLKSERLIVLADPQRISRAGARAVDGWVNDIGFTVLFCRKEANDTHRSRSSLKRADGAANRIQRERDVAPEAQSANSGARNELNAEGTVPNRRYG